MPLPPGAFPVNTHGGLLGFGAPWEAPAMFNVLEACDQLTNACADRQIPQCRRALVYGNGGVFSASAVSLSLPTFNCVKGDSQSSYAKVSKSKRSLCSRNNHSGGVCERV